MIRAGYYGLLILAILGMQGGQIMLCALASAILAFFASSWYEWSGDAKVANVLAIASWVPVAIAVGMLLF